MPYRRSTPLHLWLGRRRAALAVLVRAHDEIGQVTEDRRVLDVRKPLARAFVISVVAEFQGFVRDLHDVAVTTLATGADVPAGLRPLVIDGLTYGRQLDRGNADLRAIRSDFAGLGLTPLEPGLHNARWAKDRAELAGIFQLRNALAHGNERRVQELRVHDIEDTVRWMRARLPVLNRLARSLDHLAWDHLRGTLGVDPW
jgi:hypothetical protein